MMQSSHVRLLRFHLILGLEDTALRLNGNVKTLKVTSAMQIQVQLRVTIALPDTQVKQHEGTFLTLCTLLMRLILLDLCIGKHHCHSQIIAYPNNIAIVMSLSISTYL